MKNVESEKKKVLYRVVMDLKKKGIKIDYASSFFLTKGKKNAVEK